MTSPAPWSLGLAVGATGSPGIGAAPARAGVDVEVRVALMAGRLELGLRGGVWPAVAEPEAAVPTEASSLSLALMASWGWHLGPLELRLGAGVEGARRAIEARPATRFGTVTAVDGALTVPLEARLGWRFAPAWALEIGVGGQVPLAGATRTWLGDAVVEAPRATLGGAVRVVGWWAP